MTKVLVTGGNGQLGQSIKCIMHDYCDIEIVFTDVDTLDICDKESIHSFIKENNFKYVVNCAAYTAVDKAESDKVLAKKLNAEAVKNIAESCHSNQCKFIHISTDYVFDGKSYKPYTEECYALPESVYGETKLLGEKMALESNSETIVIRTSWLYSEFGHNFVKTMIKLGRERDELKIVTDQIGTPTYAVDLADSILSIIKKTETTHKFIPGIYHYSNEGVCSWYDFTINIHELIGVDCKVSPIESKEYPTAAPRPFYSVLNKSKVKENYHINIPYWRSSLERCLMKISSEQ